MTFLPLLPPPEQRGGFAIKPDKLSERSEFLSGRKSSALWRGPAQRARHWGALFLSASFWESKKRQAASEAATIWFCFYFWFNLLPVAPSRRPTFLLGQEK